MSKLITAAPNNERKTLWETTRQGETLCQSMRLVYRKKKKSWRSPVAGWMDDVGDLYLKLRLIVIHGFLCVDLLSCDILLKFMEFANRLRFLSFLLLVFLTNHHQPPLLCLDLILAMTLSFIRH